MKSKKQTKNNNKKVSFLSLPSTKLSIIFSILSACILIAVAITLPLILNYPPNSINTPFDIEMSGIPYVAQFACIELIALIVICFVIKKVFKPIDEWYKNKDDLKYNNSRNIDTIRKRCLNLPYIIFLVELIIPSIICFTILSITGSHEKTMILKITALIVAFTFLLAVTSYIFTKSLFRKLLSDIYRKDADIGMRINIGTKILMQVIPVCIIGMLLIALVGYTKSIKSSEDALFDVYSKNLSILFDKDETYTYTRIRNLLEKLLIYNDSASVFILSEDGEVDLLSGPAPSNFVIKYTLKYAEQNNGKTYDSYAVDTQGATIKLNTQEGSYYACILYHTNSNEALIYIIATFILVFSLILVLLIIFVRSLSKEVSMISESLSHISDNKDVDNFTTLPVISNDELGDLCIAYNNIQNMNQENLQKIKNSQDLLIERERLASLGQMIGGIAHNLKTPIMSISGATEGLSDLAKELDMSIGNPQVTEEDYHAIVKDINNWLDKIKTHTSYMSDVITAVKGQAVVFSEDQIYPFTVSELFSRVDILMKHELKNSITKLIIKNETSDNDLIHGNINSLVQIINNMISNSIQAYNNSEKEMPINLSAKIDNNRIIISVQDFGPGISKNVQDRLFKEMITTKGKEGTGLGLFMSYSNIKAHFHGNMTFETSSEGTTFYISLPIYKN